MSNARPAYRMLRTLLATLAAIVCIACGTVQAQQPVAKPTTDTSQTRLESTTIVARDSNLRVVVRNIDITKFPLVNIIFDVFDPNQGFVMGLHKNDILISENNAPQDVVSLSLITSENRVPVDFVFAIDQTGSMGDKWDPLESTCRHASLSIL